MDLEVKYVSTVLGNAEDLEAEYVTDILGKKDRLLRRPFRESICVLRLANSPYGGTGDC